MAIWKNDEGESPRFGVQGGDQWTRQQGSNTAQNAPRNANTQTRRQFRSWTNLAPWRDRWAALTTPEKTAWTDYSNATLFYGFTGQPTIIAAPDHFARYFANATFILGAEPTAPWPPPTAPTPPDDHAPFNPFLDPLNSMAITITTTTTEDLDFLFVAMIPTSGKQKLTRSRTNRIGLFTLPPTAGGDPWLEPSAAAAALYGAAALDTGAQQWLLAWQIVELYPFPVLDPCWSPPPPPPPPPDPCWSSYPETVRTYGAGGCSTGSFSFLPYFDLDKVSVDGLARFTGTFPGVVAFTSWSPPLGTVAITIQKDAPGHAGEWWATYDFTTTPDGPFTLDGPAGSIASCQPPEVTNEEANNGSQNLFFTVYATP